MADQSLIPHRWSWRRRAVVAILLLTGGCALALLAHRLLGLSAVPAVSIVAVEPPEEMVLVLGGRFIMGSDESVNAAERPAHEVIVRSFWMDVHSVTYEQFAKFVKETGYITTAEQTGHGLAGGGESGQPIRREGASWRRPDGQLAESRISSGGNYPVVQVSWYDATAYARWAGKRLPTEAEWERAARSGLAGAVFPWGSDELPGGQPQANYRQASQDAFDSGADGFLGLAPVGSFPPSRLGLTDMAGNVWHWCADWYADDYYTLGFGQQPAGPSAGQSKVVRGGCSLDGASNLKVWARGHRRPDAGYQNVGFRCVQDLPR